MGDTIKVILYMAMSINGMITRGKDDSDWVAETDWNEFHGLMKDCGVMVMGRRTYEIFGDDFPCEGTVNVVMTSQKTLLDKKTPEDVIFIEKSPKEVVEMVRKRGFEKLMLIGGMSLNTSFLKENLIDEIWLSVHPFLIGKGKTVVKKNKYFKRLKLLGVKKLGEDLVQLRYEVIK